MVLLLLAFSARAQTVVLMTDFGVKDDAVAICKGVILSIAPAARLVDLTHEVPPFSVLDGARFLAGASAAYPPGTVFMGVVDPGVGGTRRAIAVKTKRNQIFVVPDNGLITFVEQQDGIEVVREITNEDWAPTDTRSATFHGRDVFAPVAAHLAKGANFDKVGPEVETIMRLEVPVATLKGNTVSALVLAIEEPYGNLVTNLPAALVNEAGTAPSLKVRFGKTPPLTVPLVRTFGDVKPGQPLAYVDSRGKLGFALNTGHFAKKHKVTPLMPFTVTR